MIVASAVRRFSLFFRHTRNKTTTVRAVPCRPSVRIYSRKKKTGDSDVRRIPPAGAGDLGDPELRPPAALPAEGGRRGVLGGQQAVDPAARPVGVEHRGA